MLLINQKLISNLARCVLVFFMPLFQLDLFAQGDTCSSPVEIADNLPVNGSYSFTVDTSDGDKYCSFTAPESGTFEISSCSNPSYLIIYDNDCQVLHEQDMLSCSTALHAVELGDGETIKFEFDSRNNVSGMESTTATTYFQEEVDGQEPGQAIELIEGTNTMTRYLGKQYFTYLANQSGRLTIRTCNEGNPVDGTEFRLYRDESLESLLVDNTWCSNDPDGDFSQSIIEYQIAAFESVILEADPAFFWYDSYEFEVQFESSGSSCENAINISELGIYDVDNSNGDQWFAFTAPETTEIAITTGPNGDGWGSVNLASGQDTWLSVLDICEGTVIAQSDDSGVVGFRRSYATLNVTAGNTYMIQWRDQFVNAPFQYQFEIFKVEYALGNATEEEAEVIDVGVHRALLNYKDEHWFKYTFPSDGVLVAVNRDELDGRVIPSYQMLYGDNGLNLELPNEDELAFTNYSFDEWTETNFMYEGLAGEEVSIRVKEVSSIHFYAIGNRDFELAFFDGATYEDLCDYESELTVGIHEINSSDGDQKYKYSATRNGTHTFSADDNPSTLIAVYDQCFGDALYTKYNDFYYEKEMIVGEELYFVFLDEYGGACNFEITRLANECDNVVEVEEESCDEYEFGEEVLSESGQYQAHFLNQSGCDSLVNLTLNILESDEVETSVEQCESYPFGSQTLIESGTYEELFMNQEGCDSLVSLTYTRLPKPEVEITVTEKSLEAVSDDATSYQWIDCFTNTPLEGETKAELIPEASGEFAVEVSNGDCTIISDCVIFEKVLGLTSFLDQVSIYPTVTEGMVTIDLKSFKREVEVSIISMSGRSLVTQVFESLNRSDFYFSADPGIYLLQIKNLEFIHSQRIIVED